MYMVYTIVDFFYNNDQMMYLPIRRLNCLFIRKKLFNFKRYKIHI